MTIQQGATTIGPVTTAADLQMRAQAVAAIAAAHADSVDSEGRFPSEAREAMRTHRLLGAAIPIELGGEGASIRALADVCYTLGRACASTAMIFAMHQTKVACLVRHGRGEPWQDGVMRRIAHDQLLMASSTTEGNNGGNVRASVAAVEVDDAGVRLDRAATVISYGAEADGVVTVARRAVDAASSDQVLCVFLKEDYTLERLSGWETLGMRGTCSSGFRLLAHGGGEQVLKARYAEIHGQTMTPVSHILWSSAWTGIAAAAVEKAQAFTRTAMRGAGGVAPPGAVHYGRAVSGLKQARALIGQSLDRYEAASGDPAALSAMDFQTAITMLKVEVSELAVTTVMSAMRANGLAGYRQDGAFTVGRHLRDVLSAPIMIHNDRIVANLVTATLMAPVAASLRD
ncbi:acyl-CoA dehydrogenase family protein [Methylobacterium haplocladii]|uniref:Acyl-CoA dehydrogenase n=1 Tax=Methylobacterium haplocladii TaxID=1176176 RepID=A0A512IJE7_9HYPH|nr:acyl-CoA dehydrogenase family protein [Methylobacterium haplocladii]GEO97802.1 acyl-CoA dehydrogenase [Methylobacterium haplocladii]GJD82648.1 Cyclohex-1-ene-1-carbonyl-CoA dehydrogenase [Methylobacterium haplocladii]GLS57565.1 acyl-CoA dehydrogenase [Methylobacterium haplocladii]